MKIPYFSLTLVSLTCGFLLTSCTNTMSGSSTAGYDTSDPFGIPSDDGYSVSDYSPASNPTYGAAAYEEPVSTPAPPPVTPRAPSKPASSSSSGRTHTVVRGDTLWSVSRKYGVTVAALRAANGMSATQDTIVLNSTLRIP